MDFNDLALYVYMIAVLQSWTKQRLRNYFKHVLQYILIAGDANQELCALQCQKKH